MSSIHSMNPAVPTTAEQQAVINRIVAQRERLRARRAIAHGLQQGRAAPQPAKTTGTTGETAAVNVLVSMLAFARLHPLWTAAAVAAAIAAGPTRLMRWAGVVLPWAVQLSRR